MSSAIHRHGVACPLMSDEMMGQLIGHTRTKTGLTIHADLDHATHGTAESVTLRTNVDLAASPEVRHNGLGCNAIRRISWTKRCSQCGKRCRYDAIADPVRTRCLSKKRERFTTQHCNITMLEYNIKCRCSRGNPDPPDVSGFLRTRRVKRSGRPSVPAGRQAHRWRERCLTSGAGRKPLATAGNRFGANLRARAGCEDGSRVGQLSAVDRNNRGLRANAKHNFRDPV